MSIKGFGINVDASRLDNNLETLVRDLEYFARLGFEYVEIPVHGVGAMVAGRLLPRRVEEVRRLLARFPLRYTVHGPNPLNLMEAEKLSWQKQALQASLEFAAIIGAEILVYHGGRYLPEECFHLPGRRKNLRAAMKEKMLLQEREALQELAEKAAELQVTIAVENARPYLDGSPYCYAEQLSLLVEQVATVGHARVGITLDVGHAYLAARYYGFAFLEAVARAAPYIRHVHLHDNFGQVSTSLEKKQAELMATGRGDLHLPAGWGEIPLAEVLALLQDYTGVVVHEIRPRYQEWAGMALDLSRELARKAGIYL
ncbi:MAG: hypothetical protein PWR22_1522 [Moorella sp. (in: firmicutes)]|jgi:sugar phosphate isomerase/epimerase|nr:hypothetical protein [Moorella sp. (in: firmicutes)]MDK2895196.1 hypothetical protein [Moorella sp. (in: firmicutes)]